MIPAAAEASGVCVYILSPPSVGLARLTALVAICGNGDGRGKGKGRRVPDPRDGKGRRVTSGIIYYLWWRGGGVGGETREGQLPSHSGRTRVRGPGAFRGAFCSHKFREPLDAQPSRGCMTAARRASLVENEMPRAGTSAARVFLSRSPSGLPDTIRAGARALGHGFQSVARTGPQDLLLRAQKGQTRRPHQ